MKNPEISPARHILLILLITFLSAYSAEGAPVVKETGAVGGIRISEKEIRQRARVSEIYYPQSGRRYVALAQLIKGYVSLEILKSLGHKVDETVLEQEAVRIDKNTKAPDVLRKIKHVYGSDRAGYMKTFVTVVYSERVLYNEVFLKSREIHKEQFRKANGILRDTISSPGSFNEIAKKEGVKASKLRVSRKEGVLPYDDGGKRGQPGGASAGVAERLISVVSKVKESEVYPQIIEWLEGYQVIRLVGKEDESYIIESVFIPKRDYDEWFWEKAGKIPIRIHDRELKEELLREVSWAGKLSFYSEAR